MRATPGRGPASDRYRWLVFATTSVGVYLSVVDYGVVNIALPTISGHFRSSLPTVQWVVSAYLLVIVALMLPLGRAADLLGRKRVYIAGFVFFVAGAALSASAQSMTWLLIARGVQAVGAAAIQGNGMAISVSVFPQSERGKVLGFNSTVVALGAISGPSFGGLLIDLFGWRSAFLLPVCLGTAAAALSAAVLDERRIASAARSGGRLDWPGMATSAAGLVCLLLVLSRGHSDGWTAPSTLAMAAAAAASLSAFVAIELASPSPMIDLRLFQRRLFALGSMAGFLAFTGLVANTIIMPFYLQGTLGFSARVAGVITIPNMAMMAVAGPLFGRLSDRIGARVPGTLGMLCVGGGFLALTRLDESSRVWEVILPMMLSGLGMGMFQPANNSSILGSVEPERYSVVASFLTLVRNVGQVTGVVVASLVVTLAITNLGVEPDLGALRDPTRTPDPLLVRGFINGMHYTYYVSAGAMAVAALCSLARGPRPAGAGRSAPAAAATGTARPSTPVAREDVS